MSLARSMRVICRLALVFLIGSLGGCTRASVAALLPTLSLGLVTRRVGRLAADSESSAMQRWDALAVVSLHFRPRSIAAEVPLRAELAPETWIAPCDADDVICLQEAADAEAELSAAFGELQ